MAARGCNQVSCDVSENSLYIPMLISDLVTPCSFYFFIVQCLFLGIYIIPNMAYPTAHYFPSQNVLNTLFGFLIQIRKCPRDINITILKFRFDFVPLEGLFFLLFGSHSFRNFLFDFSRSFPFDSTLFSTESDGQFD